MPTSPDLADFTAALTELKRLVQPDLDPVLTYGGGVTIDTSKDLDAILESNKRASRWVTATAYYVGDVVMPTVRNGHRYRVIQAGTSATEPDWGTWSYSQVSDGDLIFEEEGEEFSNVYDIRRSAYEAWNLKTAKAASKNQVISDGRGQAASYLYLNCVRERDKYRSVSVV